MGRHWNTRSHDHKCYEVSKAITWLTRHDLSLPRGSDGAIHYSYIIDECRKKFDDASQWPLEDWISTLAQGGGAKTRFQYCVNPNSSNQFLYLQQFKDIQETMLLILHCKTMYCYRKDLPSTSTTSGTRVNWILQQEMDILQEGTSLKERSGLLHHSEPMEDVYGMEETPCVLTKTSIAPYKNTWTRLQNTVFGAIWSSFKRFPCNFTETGHMLSFSTTHCLQLALRKRHVWKLRRWSARRFA